ncbi:DUF1194 domain-containing protein [Elioraea sp.]|jgi:hypothetical protein|uniref:DUF1194 domain-containing protein n=1 Tax=Elioraea sp. TaxID=2185103 RepID=UPI0021DD9DBF|nr:DUF1194 domain-containing protein [Elioraea sp.]GIX10005.1 MAG: hypothetical protein KatS3mg116_1715 [Elioraea sp.]
MRRRLVLGAPAMLLPAATAPVDLALVLAVDVSASVDFAEFGLMIGGYAAAFRDAELAGRLVGGPRGAAAVAMLFWSGPGARDLAVPWTRVADVAQAGALAEAIEQAPRIVPAGATALGEGLAAAAALLARCPYPAARRVIDVSGDGSTNAGLPVAAGRAAALALGATVNGLAVVDEEPDLEDYYRREVIGGPGAFVMRAEDYAAFAEAILRKLLRETAGPLVA